MLGWTIPTLVCIAYFLYEARRAPIIEDDEEGDVEGVAARDPKSILLANHSAQQSQKAQDTSDQ